MSPARVTTADPTGDPPAAALGPGTPDAMAVYAWEATDEQVAERFGVAIEAIVRFDLNTSPVPPELAARILAAGRFESPLSDYPPSDYRRLVEAAADTYGVDRDEVLVGAGADEVLDMVGKAFLEPGGTAVVPVPTYAMYRVISEQRRGRVVAVPRLGPADGYALNVPATREAARSAQIVWLCDPNNPTARSEPDGTVETLLAGLAGDAAAEGRVGPVVVIDEAYAEYVGRTHLRLRSAYPRLVVVRTASKAYALAGLRVGFAIGLKGTIAAVARYRPPGSVATTSATVVAQALRDGQWLTRNVDRVVSERERLAAALRGIGWTVEPSVTNFLVCAFGSPEEARRMAHRLLGRGLVPRTFPAGHEFAAALRITVRSPEDDDRLVAVAGEEAR